MNCTAYCIDKQNTLCRWEVDEERMKEAVKFESESMGDGWTGKS